VVKLGYLELNLGQFDLWHTATSEIMPVNPEDLIGVVYFRIGDQGVSAIVVVRKSHLTLDRERDRENRRQRGL
jgi:hypothetical protein